LGFLKENTPKHTITNSEVFQKGREQLGELILQKMKITGGTDVDWLIERRGGFIILESKIFRDNQISIPLGQMIAFEKLHERLTSGGKCYFYVFANDDVTDFTNPKSAIWYFEMKHWKNGTISQNKTKTGKYYSIKKEMMTEIPISDFRSLMEGHWNEFEKGTKK
jgi:hypothetical protein